MTPEIDEEVSAHLVSMFRDLAMRRVELAIPMLPVMDVEGGMRLRLPVPDQEVAFGGAKEGWWVGVSGTGDAKAWEVVAVCDEALPDGKWWGYGCILVPTDSDWFRASRVVVLLGEEGDERCLLSLSPSEEQEFLSTFLMEVCVGTLMAWSGSKDGGVLH